MTNPETLVESGITSSESGADNLDFSGNRAARKQHDAIVKWAFDNYRAIRNARTIQERQWYLNLAFYFGKQNVAILKPQSYGVGTGSQARLWVPPAPYYRARPVINRIRPTIRTELAQLTANRPNASITPASAEDRDMYAAMAGEQIWQNFYVEKKLKAVIRRAMWWTLTCGNGFIKCWWDGNEGELEPVMDQAGMPQIDPSTGQPAMQPVGDVLFQHETPFHVMVPDLKEEELESQPFLIHAQTKSPEWVKMRFTHALDGSELNANNAGQEDILEDSFLNLIGTQALNRQQSIMVYEVWVKPGSHPMFPEGAFFTIVGDKIVQGQQGWPYSHGKYPFAKFDHIPSGKFYSSSSIDDLIPLQREYNRCYDSETEILTETGWRRGIELEPGERVLSFDPNTKKMAFSSVREVFKKQYSGPVTVLENNQISARTTPGHKWFVKSSEGKDKVVTELNSDHSIPLCAPVELEGDDRYDFNKIVGLVLSDGRINQGKVFISQSWTANADKCEEIETLLETEGVNYSPYLDDRHSTVNYYIPVEYGAKIRQVIPNKRLTAEYIMTLGHKGLQGLFDGLMLGDGMYDGNKGGKFYTSLESEADLMHMICSLLGYAAVTRKQTAKSSWSVRPYQYIVQIKTDKFSKATVFRAKKADEHYEGIIWCPTVDTGFVYVRRNGRSYISGNTRGQIIEAKNRMAKPYWVAYRGSVDASKITTEPGQVIEVTPGFDYPQQSQMAPLPNYVLQEIDRILMDWNDISGQHEVTHGQVPPGVTAATAISYLQERDEAKMSVTFDSLEESIEKIAQMSLSYVKEYWSTEHLVKISGPDGSFDVMAFKGSDLRNNLDIRVEAGSALPVSKAAKQALIMDLMKMGFVEPRKGLEVMDMGGINKIYEQIQVDQRQAQRENLRMSKVTEELLMQFNQAQMEALESTQGQAFDGNLPPLIVPVNSWDNHKLHIEYHNNFRKGQAFEQLPDFIKALFEAHVGQHILALGVETETMNPRKAVGLPDEGEEELGEEQEQSPVGQEQPQPGPEAMPEMEMG